ncbi:glutathione ABC transporter substrate-binding protein [Ornithinibacillus sp. L9]|uniref:Glutathione ABC transporter substrate-binding protein n=1 Tax=Ornithinibacillus caprae TaxID=2678566 RepID=A0A6N8FGE7_9BACI|nr:glutathione ABC transporter substrate-binding protein [Ornithinibacillus caprae]MUK88742.1 glutathione ABC transporter substrate-binding protein [Ornithinibacillus caprae]
MKISKNSFIFLVMALLLTLVIAACASEPEETGSTTDDNDTEETGETNEDETTEEGESSAGGNDLVIANSSDAVSLDPAGSNDVPSSNVAANIYESLVQQDQNMELQPSLAESWEAVEDNVWEFKLREGVKFHDGSDFNADVVKANIERVLDPDVASPRAFLYSMVTDIEVVDDYTVRFTTEFPFSALPAHLAHNGGAMVSLEQIEADYAAMEAGEDPGSVINENPVGTGFFKFDEWVPGQHVRLVRNDDYWGEPAKLDSVTFKVVDEDLTRVAELRTGDSHISDPLSPSDVAEIENTDGLSVATQASVSLSYIGFNMDKEPFDDPKVRQALNMAIDKSQIIDGIYDGIGIPAIGPLAPDVFGYDDSVSGLEYDPERAKELLAEAGYEDGFSTTLWTNDNRERMDVATNVQAQLKEFGIDVEVEVVEWGAYLEQTANGEHDMFILGWSTVTGDADYGLYALFHSDNVGDPGNRTFTKDEDLDAILDAARQESDPDERLALYKEAQELLTDIAPMLYIHHQEYLLGVSDKVKGLTQDPTGILQLQDVTIEE